VTTTRTAGRHEEQTTDPGGARIPARLRWAHLNSACSLPSPGRSLRAAEPAFDRCVARGETSRPDSAKRQSCQLSSYRFSAGGPQPRHPRRGGLSVRTRSDDFADTHDPSHQRHRPHADCPPTAGPLARHRRNRRSCAFGAVLSAVAPDARQAAASCFHTLVSPIAAGPTGSGRPDTTPRGSSSSRCRTIVGASRGARWPRAESRGAS
jgi:hypothetical protein